MYYMGIDPGISGGLAVIDDSGKCVFAKPTPCIKIKKNNKEKSDYDVAAMSDYIRNFLDKDMVVCQELTHAMPGNGGVSMYHFGRGHGIWEGIVGAFAIKQIFCTPQKWKAMYPELAQEKLSKEQRALMTSNQAASWRRKVKSESKKKSISLAKKMFKEVDHEMTKVKHDGVAEALLIANWLRSQNVK